MSMPPCYTGSVKNVNVRVPDDLHERVVAESERDLRSLNAEILWLLTLGLEQAERNRELLRREPANASRR